MGHGHGHGHAPAGESSARYLTYALILILVFMAAEVVVGVLANSLALISDAAHMLTDAAAIALALVAMRMASRPARGNFTFGLRRIEILAAQANGVTLALLCVYFVYEAVRRLFDPPAVEGGLVLATALAGIVVNLGATRLVSRANRSSLNVEGAFQHILNDLFAFVATAVAGLIVLTTGWRQADSIATLVVAALMAKAAYDLISAAWRVFLEAAPEGVDVAAIDADLHAMAGVVDVHDLHVWEVTSGFPALSAHVLVTAETDCHQARLAIVDLLNGRYEIEHSTLQVDHPMPQQVIPPEDLMHRPDA